MATDESSFDALYDRHYLEILRYCFRRVRNQQDAEELANETFVRAYLHWQKFESRKGAFRALIFTIAHNLCIDFIRSKAHRKQQKLEPYDEELPHDQEIHPKPQPPASENHLDKQIVRWVIEECMKNLDKRDAEIVELYYYHGLILEEIAQMFGYNSPNWGKKQLKRAQALLKKCFEKHGLDRFSPT